MDNNGPMMEMKALDGGTHSVPVRLVRSWVSGETEIHKEDHVSIRAMLQAWIDGMARGLQAEYDGMDSPPKAG